MYSYYYYIDRDGQMESFALLIILLPELNLQLMTKKYFPRLKIYSTGQFYFYLVHNC